MGSGSSKKIVTRPKNTLDNASSIKTSENNAAQSNTFDTKASQNGSKPEHLTTISRTPLNSEQTLTKKVMDNLTSSSQNTQKKTTSTSNPHHKSWMSRDVRKLMKTLSINDDKKNWWNVVDELIDETPTQITPQTQRKTWQTVRLFISSTFKDMNNEREYLIKKIIPVLRNWCEDRKIRLIECDLRWGVPKDSDTRETLMACLSELDRCREENELPYFLCMLSERYGYVCDPLDVPEDIKIRYNWLPGMSVTALEIFTGAYWDQNKHAIYMLRDPKFLDNVQDDHIRNSYIETKEESKQSLQILKEKLHKHFPDQIRKYSCEVTEEVDGHLKLKGFEYFGEEIIKHFKRQIEEQYPSGSIGEELTKVEVQREQQKDFLIQRSQYLLGRDSALSTMKNYLEDEKKQSGLLLLVGYPGAGKSSLMAYSARQTLNIKSYKVFYHFVGATPDSTDPYSILSRFYKECLPDDANLPKDLDEMLRFAPTMFTKAAEKAKADGYSRLVIYFDALNQMDEDENAVKLSWLPRILYPGMRIIVSTLKGPCLDALRSHKEKPEEIAVEPLNLIIRREIVTNVLAEYNKQLDSEQMTLLVSKEDAGRPLWLSIACEYLRVYGDFKSLTEKIQNLPKDLSGLTHIVLEHIIHEYGGGIVKATLCLLECSRFGLMESELLELLALAPYSTPEQTDNSDNGKITMAQWAFLYLGLKPFLRPFGGSGEGRLDFYHRSTSKVVRQTYLENTQVKNWWHRRLADYFSRSTDVVRKSEELPYHLQQLNCKEELMQCLVNKDVFKQLYQEKTKQQLLRYCQFAGGYEKATQYYMKAVEDIKKDESINEETKIYLLSQIGWFLVDMGEYDVAEIHLNNQITELETKYGENGKQLCSPLYALLTLYYRAGLKFVYGSSEGFRTNRRKGQVIGEHCTAAYAANYDKDDPELGEVYTLAGYFDRKYLDKAQAIFSAISPDHPGLAQVYLMLGGKSSKNPDMNVPINYFEKSLSLCLSSFGKIHLHTARCYQLYGQMYWNTWVRDYNDDHLRESIGHYKNELEILEEIFGPNHPNVVRSREDVVIVLDRLGRKDESMAYKKLQPDKNESLNK